MWVRPVFFFVFIQIPFMKRCWLLFLLTFNQLWIVFRVILEHNLEYSPRIIKPFLCIKHFLALRTQFAQTVHVSINVTAQCSGRKRNKRYSCIPKIIKIWLTKSKNLQKLCRIDREWHNSIFINPFILLKKIFVCRKQN